MRLSIITINYNNVEGLRRTIDSVLAQSWTDFEWIVIDGGSTDGSRELIEQNASHFAYWCSEPDSGIFNAMNKGIDHTDGEYLHFLNSGDAYCDSETLSKIFNASKTADVLYGHIQLRDDEGKIAGLHLASDQITASGYLNDFCIPHHQSAFIRRALMLSHKYDERFRIFSDVEFFAYAFSQGATFEKIDLPVALYQLGGVSGGQGWRRSVEIKRAKLSGLSPLFPGWFKLFYLLIPNIPCRPKWALVKFLCAIAIRRGT